MKNVLLIGSGQMAIDYTKVLRAQDAQLTVIGRGEVSAAKFKSETGIDAHLGGLSNYLMNNDLPPSTYVIAAVGTEMLMNVLLELIQHVNVKAILLEKPGAVSIEELILNKPILLNAKKPILLAYNRRFYSSVLESERLIKEDGGLQAIHFEFTEWSHKITPSPKPLEVKQNWLFANSTHVIDLAFHLAGIPREWQSYSKSGSLSWHKYSQFSGAGITENEVLFSYIADWESAGRWGIELLTSKRRIYLKPMEEVHIQEKGSIQISKHVFDQTIDQEFKPGLYKQVQAFLDDDHYQGRLINIDDQISISESVYQKILTI